MTARKNDSRPGDVRAAARLLTDATAGLADLVEAMHARIARLPGTGAIATNQDDPPSTVHRTRGVTGLVYKSVRGTTRLVGGSIDALLSGLSAVLPKAPLAASDSSTATPRGATTVPRVPSPRQPERDAVVAALNGVLGDYLASTGNSLAWETTLHAPGGAVLENLDVEATSTTNEQGIVVLLHGLCMNDLQWQRKGHDHGAALHRDLGLRPVYVRYNSGLHVSINGRALTHRLERLLTPWPEVLNRARRLVIVGHSMGGLVARSALHHAALAGHAWPAMLREMVFLGTPHHGSALERAGNWLDAAMGLSSYAAPLARLGKVRSAGITDLRFGNLVDEDWVGRDRFARGNDRRQPLPLPAQVRCYAMAASRGDEPGDIKGRLLGDGLVSIDSALGRHADPALTLTFAVENVWIGHGMNHFDLLSDPRAYAQLRDWLASRRGAIASRA